MPKLDARLIAVTQQIRSKTHVDIGSDHGGLLVSMLSSGRVEYGIAIENKPQPFQNSVRALTGLPAEVRFGDGLHVLQPGEADSLSICGMGAISIRRILAAFPDRVPSFVVLQANNEPELLRAWALESGYHLVEEQVTRGRRPFLILVFQRINDPNAAKANDPAYEGLNRQAALLFGPHIMKRYDESFQNQLRSEEAYWGQFKVLQPDAARRLELIREILDSPKIARSRRC